MKRNGAGVPCMQQLVECDIPNDQALPKHSVSASGNLLMRLNKFENN